MEPMQLHGNQPSATSTKVQDNATAIRNWLQHKIHLRIARGWIAGAGLAFLIMLIIAFD